jgi:hypothetical protein
MNTLTHHEEINSTSYCLTHYFDTKECYEIVKEASQQYWEKSTKSHGRENYEFGDQAKQQALGPMLLNSDFDGGFTVLSMNEKPWSFGGIRKYNNETALIMGRHFSFYTMKLLTHGLLLPFHLQVAKDLGYKKAWITINNYNMYWYQTWYIKKYKRISSNTELGKLYTNSNECISKCKNIGELEVNYTNQTVLEWDL